MSVDDHALVRRCLAGHADAMRGLVERFEPEVLGLSTRLLQHRQDAEDVAQEVFIRVFRSLKRWDASRPLRPWILGITVNRCRTWMAQRKKRPELSEYLQDSCGREDPQDASELVNEICAAVNALREEYRAVFVMFHEQSLPYDEIALALDRACRYSQDLAASGADRGP